MYSNDLVESGNIDPLSRHAHELNEYDWLERDDKASKETHSYSGKICALTIKAHISFLHLSDLAEGAQVTAILKDLVMQLNPQYVYSRSSWRCIF